ncbi:hypothetical protein [Ramlibacter albus]|uniref:Uncharacterized protein n=1 Tax=Ramlibacter albus TaxID=2079448 RepID=A0A923M485_9BURK|nr:hypothetical protein [Ramlibacter albus]MBC5763090.1 hypothetical protein [Ramlibacter albus]
MGSNPASRANKIKDLHVKAGESFSFAGGVLGDSRLCLIGATDTGAVVEKFPLTGIVGMTTLALDKEEGSRSHRATQEHEVIDSAL